MVKRHFLDPPLAAVLSVALTAAGLAATGGPAAAHHGSGPTPVVLFSSDGMRPDLMQRYADEMRQLRPEIIGATIALSCQRARSAAYSG